MLIIGYEDREFVADSINELTVCLQNLKAEPQDLSGFTLEDNCLLFENENKEIFFPNIIEKNLINEKGEIFIAYDLRNIPNTFSINEKFPYDKNYNHKYRLNLTKNSNPYTILRGGANFVR